MVYDAARLNNSDAALCVTSAKLDGKHVQDADARAVDFVKALFRVSVFCRVTEERLHSSHQGIPQNPQQIDPQQN
jgi:hypothetical protein